MLTLSSGKYKGKHFVVPKKLAWLVPPPWFCQKVFSMLQTPVAHKVVLDLFAGPGFFTAELLSRGAVKVVASEDNLHLAGFIQQNLGRLKATNYELHTTGYQQLLKHKTNSRFNLAFVHPFCDDNRVVNATLKTLAQLRLLSRNGQIVLFGFSATTISLPRLTLPPGLIVQRLWQSTSAYVLTIANI